MTRRSSLTSRKGFGRAAAIAGLPRAAFLEALIEKGITLLDGPSTLAAELEAIAERLGSSRLAAAATALGQAGD